MEKTSRPIALTIAGFDPSSGAGITADLKTFAAHGVYGVACISALTVQSTLGVQRVERLKPDLVRQTLGYLAEDIALAGVKIGMLGSAEVAAEVGAFLASRPAALRRRIVLDPVLRSSSGTPLIDPEGVKVIREELLPLVSWVTPNVDELALLAGDGSVEEAAVRLQKIAGGNLNVVVTGGHLSRPDDFLLTAAGEGAWFQGERISTDATHGTGCAFSSALLCRLVGENTPQEAVAQAKAFVTGALRSAYPIGKGKGPMNHLFRLPIG